MPNWITNEVLFMGPREEMRNLRNRLHGTFDDGTESPFDFDSLVPMPKELRKIRTGGCTIDDEYVTSWWEDEEGNRRAVTEQEKAALIEAYGHDNGYPWALMNWGCKWNAGEAEELLGARANGSLLRFARVRRGQVSRRLRAA